MFPLDGDKAMKGFTLQEGKKWVASFGVYVIIILALLRLVIFPLHAAVTDRRAELEDQRQRNIIKTKVLEQVRQSQKENSLPQAGMRTSAPYPREMPISKIQADVVTTIKELSESKGLMMTGFEMPETAIGKKISEVPVVARLKGRAEPLLDVLKMIRNREKPLMIKAMDVSTDGPELTVSLTIKVFRLET